MSIEMIIAVIGLAAKVIEFGAPAVESAIKALNKDDITVEDIQNLKITKDPEEF